MSDPRRVRFSISNVILGFIVLAVGFLNMATAADPWDWALVGLCLFAGMFIIWLGARTQG